MKKYILLIIVAFSFVLFSCEDDKTEPGGTAVEKMAGDWWVTYQSSVEEYNYLFGGEGSMPSVDNIENWTWDYVYSDAHSLLFTYNTAANTADSMFISDDGAYWDFKAKVGVNYPKRIFANSASVPNLSYDSSVEIIGGKILEGAATSPSGMPVDSIVFYIKFSDDSYGFTYTKVSGFRRTGFPADEFE